MQRKYSSGLQVVEGLDMEQVNNQLFENQDSITALAGGGYHSTTPVLNAGNCRVSTVANANDSVALPHAVANPAYGLTEINVVNDTVTSMNVFPQPADKINAGVAGAAFAVAGGKSVTFFCPSGGRWFANLSA